MTSLLVSCKIAGDSKPLSSEVHLSSPVQKINCTNYTKSKVSSFTEDTKVREHWLVKMKRESFEPKQALTHLCVLNKICQLL